LLIVPVIDLMDGRVVHARRGDRANYRPLQSVLTQSSEPAAVVAALLELAPFPAVYAADLDAILRRGQHGKLLREIAHRFRPLELWVDAGFAAPPDLEPWQGEQGIVPVIGSESVTAAAELTHMLALAPHAVLSLDTRAEMQLGPADLFACPHSWPERVIVMTLDRVGAGTGPGFVQLRDTAARAPATKLIAAGGVRNVEDLETLEALGVHAVLVASAIHDGTLDRAALSRFIGTA
jgi:phosphoribosylformimino-5-aminoimidazole carboxamide ribotide isomerase